MGVAVGVGDGLKVAVGVGGIVDVGSAVGAGGDQLGSGVLAPSRLVVDEVGASGLLAVCTRSRVASSGTSWQATRSQSSMIRIDEITWNRRNERSTCFHIRKLTSELKLVKD
jgi:hypothetical protein